MKADRKTRRYELREYYKESCEEFIRKHKAIWESEGFHLEDELMLWVFKIALENVGKERKKLGLMEV
jgi:hypothetical protein